MMKAFLLAAGLGTRLRPLTNATPKCLITIAGKPMLTWWLDLLLLHGVDEVLINTHHLHEQVSVFIRSYNAQRTGLYVNECYEPELLGSGGTIRNHRWFVEDQKDFLICYADNLTRANLTSMVAYHREKADILTMALFHSPSPEQCGIAQVDSANKITSFVEKPAQPIGDLANAGIYIASPRIFDFFPDKGFIDIGHDVLPNLIGHMYGYELLEYLLDIGTLDNLEKARREWQRGDHQDAPPGKFCWGRH